MIGKSMFLTNKNQPIINYERNNHLINQKVPGSVAEQIPRIGFQNRGPSLVWFFWTSLVCIYLYLFICCTDIHMFHNIILTCHCHIFHIYNYIYIYLSSVDIIFLYHSYTSSWYIVFTYHTYTSYILHLFFYRCRYATLFYKDDLFPNINLPIVEKTH